ncbi:MAG TPA: sensor domain-containing diguanylate cyclase [Terriglobales bacterium]|nr:sensor domain-containing diguanylate cyclase [Terriglobales bacterium]
MSSGYTSVRDVAVLQQATQLILASTDLETVLHQALLVVRTYFGAGRCAVFLLDEPARELYPQTHHGYEAGTTPGRLRLDGEGTPQRAAQTRFLVHVHGEAANGGTELALPLLVRDQLLGVLLLVSDNPDAFPESTVPLLSLFAAQTAVAVENARLHSTALRRRRQIELINLIARTAASASHTQQFFFTLTDLLGDAFEGARVAIVLRGPQGIFVPAVSPNGEPDLERFRASARDGVLAKALEQRAAVLEGDVAANPGWPACFAHTGSELCAPLVFLGEAMGAMVLAHESANFFSADDRTLAQAAADVCATATRNVQLAEELHRVANQDFLTGCHNQRYFYFVLAQEVARARRYNKQFAVILLDLRHFRQVNATYGFEAGDQLLHKVARSLQMQLRSNDVLCRYMSDRFAVVLPEIDRRGAEAVMGKLRAAVEGINLPRSKKALEAASASVMCPHDGVSELELANLLLERLEKQKSGGQASGVGSQR